MIAHPPPWEPPKDTGSGHGSIGFSPLFLPIALWILAIFFPTTLVAQDCPQQPAGGVWVMVNNLPGASEEVGEDLLTYFDRMKGPPTRVVHPVQLLHLLEPDQMRP